ncbi:toll/interleukin-1 receptor domain-containing protein [Streptomyces sp. ISL-11]|nr:toll/interleukin-1 receptor domain-containing protein [Streptomyces sp. ISL-11]
MDDAPAGQGSFRYDGFISYSHAADSAKSAHLRRGLQNFARNWRQLRALRIFLDNASLSANPSLWGEVERNLSGSGTFILLASPEAARSPWVAKEIAWWRAGSRARHLLIVVTGGELAWNHGEGDFDWDRTDCLPRALEGAFTEEPRWVDLRWMTEEDSGSLRDPRFQKCVADLAAPLHGRPKEDLIGEDVTQHRRVRRFTRGAVAAITALAVAAGTTSVIAFQQRDRARDQTRLSGVQHRREDSLRRLGAVCRRLGCLRRASTEAGDRPASFGEGHERPFRHRARASPLRNGRRDDGRRSGAHRGHLDGPRTDHRQGGRIRPVQRSPGCPGRRRPHGRGRRHQG